MHLRSNLTSGICQKVGTLDGKTEQNRFKVPFLQPFFFFFFFKKPLYLSKTKSTSRFYIVKISVATNFMCLDLRTALKYLLL